MAEGRLWFERRSHQSSTLDLRRMLADAKKPPAGPPRHEARQAAQTADLLAQRDLAATVTAPHDNAQRYRKSTTLPK